MHPHTDPVPKRPVDVAVALGFTLLIILVGYLAAGPVIGLTFTGGFIFGFFVWLARPQHATFRAIKAPYLLVILGYAVHRTEEEIGDFLPQLEELQGSEMVEVTSFWSLTLVALSVIWFLAPLLMRRGHSFGHFAAWSVFIGFGVLEFAHYLFPFFDGDGGYSYYGGMWTVPLVAPIGWWGMWRLWVVPRNREAASGSTTRQTASEPSASS